MGVQHFLWTGDQHIMTFSMTEISGLGTKTLRLALLGLLAGTVIGCSDFRRAIGEEKSSPDEFEVVVRPPLSLPPGFSDRPEDIRAQEEKAVVATDSKSQAQSILGTSLDANIDASATGYGQIFDFASIPENIRETVDEETYGIQFERRLPLERLFGDLPDIGPVLDKMAEDQRIRKNRQEGLLPTEGDTIAIDAQSNETVIIKE